MAAAPALPLTALLASSSASRLSIRRPRAWPHPHLHIRRFISGGSHTAFYHCQQHRQQLRYCSPTFVHCHHSIDRRGVTTKPAAAAAAAAAPAAPAAKEIPVARAANHLTSGPNMQDTHAEADVDAHAPVDADAVAQLSKYTACDVSDALLKLKVPGAGFVADLNLYSTLPSGDADSEAAAVVVAPVSTVLFAPKDGLTDEPASNMPQGKHWADITQPGSVVVLKQPPGQTNAVCGGIMALRMKVRDVRGIVVGGRVRDLAELRSTQLPIWAQSTSTVGSGGASIPWAVQVPVEINGIVINPGDIAFVDPQNGVVVIPADKVTQVLTLLPKLTTADDRVKEEVLRGMSVQEAFKLHRG